jgi:DNA gyrase subunit A
MLISDQGTLVRTRSEEVSVQGRNTQGVRLINLGGDEHLVGLARVEEPADDEDAMASDEDMASTDTPDTSTSDTGTSDTGTSDTGIVGEAGDDADSGHSPDDTDTQ